ncbi:MAG TPA: Nramp family divalent metal transporter [Candidatus Acidoferrales bacterium]|nr:Nramp family divalent metal transporter [Candidatus Acidoferrales bacterium]
MSDSTITGGISGELPPTAAEASGDVAVASTSSPAKKPRTPREAWWYLGPAFVASVAYMDPGNFATNIEGGARFGYELLWVLLWSNAMAILVQYLAAKLGISTGKTLPENCRAEFSRPVTLCLWFAAEIAAMATDLAEFLGAALGFYLLFGIPMLPAAILTGVCVMLILAIEQVGFQWLERVIMSFVGVIGIAYAFEMFLSKPAWQPILKNVLIPEIHSSSIYIAVSMLGATVMPHVIYLHSALVLPRREEHDRTEHHHRKMELLDVLLAMNGAWLINSAMVVMAAAVFFGSGTHVYSIEEAHHTLAPLLGKFASVAFAVALLASGLSSSTVGTMAGQVILQGFLNLRISIFLRRIVTMVPAIIVIAVGLDPLKTLVLSQAVLSFCLPFAMIPLLILTQRKDLMGTHANRPITNYLAAIATFVILGMNVWLLFAIFTGKS